MLLISAYIYCLQYFILFTIFNNPKNYKKYKKKQICAILLYEFRLKHKIIVTARNIKFVFANQQMYNSILIQKIS